MIDTHCHLTFPELHDRVEDVIAAAAEDGVDRMITIATTPADGARAAALAERFSGVYFAIGVHPHYAEQVSLSDIPRIAEMAAHPKCVAFGEMGLDYHYPDPPRPVQHELFRAQLEMVRYSEITKPIILHCRKAVDDTIAHIHASGLHGSRFVFHCCTEPPDQVRKMLDLGAMVSFTGIATYKNAPEVRESAALVPLTSMMIETDSPYLTPEPHRKIRPNEPRYVAATARFLAEWKGIPFEQFTRRMDDNATRFFDLG